MNKILITLYLCFLCSFAACSSSSKSNSTIAGQTLGQEFIDLKRAQEMGALSSGEYKRIRDRLVEENK